MTCSVARAKADRPPRHLAARVTDDPSRPRALEADTVFRRETGAVPISFELAIPETDVAGVRLRGFADRIDRTPDGKKAWSSTTRRAAPGTCKDGERSPRAAPSFSFLYISLLSATPRRPALYWFITQRGDFSRITYTPARSATSAFRTPWRIVGGIRAGAFPAVPNEEDEWKGG